MRERAGEVHGARHEMADRPGQKPSLQATVGWHPAARYRGGVPAALKTTVTELPESRVRVQVQVPANEVEARLERKARQLGREMKLPGFRRGKVPAPLVIQRVGREAVLEGAVRDTLSNWYADAIETAGIVPVGDPKLDLSDLPPKGEQLEFSIEIGVLPSARLGRYRGLQVARREPAADEEGIEHELDGMRERLARLEDVERAAEPGDFVVVDYAGSIDGSPFKGGEGRDQLVELGSGNLIEGFEQGLLGAGSGEARTVDVSFPEDYSNPELAGRDASFEVTVKRVKRKLLPQADDDFALEMGFDSLEELREEVRERLLDIDRERVQAEFREAALDAVAADAQISLPATLVRAKAVQMWEGMVHSLSHRGVSRESYLQIAGRTEQELIDELVGDAEQSLRRQAAIAGVIEAERIAPGDDDVEQALASLAEREGVEREKLIARLRDSGRLEEVREDIAVRLAVDLIAEHAEPISPEQAAAREKLWTPGSQRTPGS
jgi:trigger factor